MKKILTLTFIAGAVAGIAFYLLTRRSPEERAADEVGDTAKHVFDTMDETLKKVERKTERATGLR